jgi:peptidoglycan hydrolase-like protein with peptidoglycan-binding domain
LRLIVHDPASTLQERNFGDIKTFETQCKQYFIFFVKQQIEPAKLPTLKNGMNNQYVKSLQELLNKFGYKMTVDGDFGIVTEGLVRDFQRTRGLIADGVVGQKTWNKLYGV